MTTRNVALLLSRAILGNEENRKNRNDHYSSRAWSTKLKKHAIKTSSTLLSINVLKVSSKLFCNS